MAGTLLTLVFLPALYVAWFGGRKVQQASNPVMAAPAT